MQAVAQAKPDSQPPLAVLVLGMCFFAGGTRFSEQGFGISSCSSYVYITVELNPAYHRPDDRCYAGKSVHADT